jgi:hypothetical protein
MCGKGLVRAGVSYAERSNYHNYAERSHRFVPRLIIPETETMMNARFDIIDYFIVPFFGFVTLQARGPEGYGRGVGPLNEHLHL